MERKFDDIEESTRVHENFMKTFHNTEADAPKVILKASDFGTIETILAQIDNIRDQEGNINFEILRCEVGCCTETDLIECLEFNASMYCFDVNPAENINSQARKEGIEMHSFDIIYKLIESLKDLNNKLYDDKHQDVEVKGSACVQQIYEINLNKQSNIFI